MRLFDANKLVVETAVSFLISKHLEQDRDCSELMGTR